MPWNDNKDGEGSSKGSSPWGSQGKKSDSPWSRPGGSGGGNGSGGGGGNNRPDLEEQMRRMQERFRRGRGGNGGGGRGGSGQNFGPFGFIVLGFVALHAWLFSGVVVVAEGEPPAVSRLAGRHFSGSPAMTLTALSNVSMLTSAMSLTSGSCWRTSRAA